MSEKIELEFVANLQSAISDLESFQSKANDVSSEFGNQISSVLSKTNDLLTQNNSAINDSPIEYRSYMDTISATIHSLT